MLLREMRAAAPHHLEPVARFELVQGGAEPHRAGGGERADGSATPATTRRPTTPARARSSREPALPDTGGGQRALRRNPRRGSFYNGGSLPRSTSYDLCRSTSAIAIAIIIARAWSSFVRSGIGLRGESGLGRLGLDLFGRFRSLGLVISNSVLVMTRLARACGRGYLCSAVELGTPGETGGRKAKKVCRWLDRRAFYLSASVVLVASRRPVERRGLTIERAPVRAPVRVRAFAPTKIAARFLVGHQDRPEHPIGPRAARHVDPTAANSRSLL